MTMIFGVPLQAFLGQLLIGLINGSFYAMLSLGLAIIFGLLRVINFAHGAQYMLGAFVGYLLLAELGIGYWPALILAPLVVGLAGAFIERVALSRLYNLDHLYGLLFTFGLALVIEGTFRYYYGAAGQPYAVPSALAGGVNLGFMFLPKYRAWVVVASLVVCLGTWLLIEKTRLGSYLRAATENPTLGTCFRHQRAPPVDVHLRSRRRSCRARGYHGGADLSGQPAYGIEHDYRCLCRGCCWRYGINPWRHHHRLYARYFRGSDKSVLSGSVQHRHLRHHGNRPACPTRGSVRKGCMI